MTKKELGRKARRYLLELGKGRAAYDAADQLLGEILKAVAGRPAGDGAKIDLYDGKGKPAGQCEIVDNFAEKNTVFRAHGIKRFELKLTAEGARS